MFAGIREPAGWAFCDGRTLSIAEYPNLFGVIGTLYGGNGTTDFNLPDFRGRLPIHQGQGPGLSNRPLSGKFGVESVTLGANHIAAHTHAVVVGGDATSPAPAGMFPANSVDSDLVTEFCQYKLDKASASMSDAAIGPSSVIPASPHSNLMPALCVNFIIALQGWFPPRGY